MCRWFAYISQTEPCLLEDVLILPAHSISKQVNDHYLPMLLLDRQPGGQTTEAEITVRNRLLNIDGFGVVYYTATQAIFAPVLPSPSSTGSASDPKAVKINTPSLMPAMYKCAQPPISDQNFRSLCANTASTAVFAHIRAATATAVTPVNNHPFTFGRYAFMHNGYVSDFVKIKREIANLIGEDEFGNVQGSTDSEHLAALFITNLSKGKGKASWTDDHTVEQILEALHQTVHQVIGVQEKVLGQKRQPNDLNLAVTDGAQLAAYRFRNHVTQQPPSLYWSESAGIRLNRQYPGSADSSKDVAGTEKNEKKSEGSHGKHVIVASEPTTHEENQWTLIQKNNYLAVGRDGKVKVDKVPFEQAYFAEDNSSGE
jgi:glutamine amidotransferase